VNLQRMKCSLVLALFVAAMLGSVPHSGAAPISPSTNVLKQAAPSSEVTEVYYRRHYRGRGYYGAPAAAAIGLGILGAAAGAAAYGAYGPGYYEPSYAPGYYAAPGYYGGAYPYRRHYAPY
jgi:hypothetical protein